MKMDLNLLGAGVLVIFFFFFSVCVFFVFFFSLKTCICDLIFVNET